MILSQWLQAQLVVPYDLYAAALCLDGPTLANLELLEGSGGDAEGSLLAALDTCASPGEPSAAPVCTTAPFHAVPICSLCSESLLQSLLAVFVCSLCLDSLLRLSACRACDFCGALSVGRKCSKAPLL